MGTSNLICNFKLNLNPKALDAHPAHHVWLRAQNLGRGRSEVSGTDRLRGHAQIRRQVVY